MRQRSATRAHSRPRAARNRAGCLVREPKETGENIQIPTNRRFVAQAQFVRSGLAVGRQRPRSHQRKLRLSTRQQHSTVFLNQRHEISISASQNEAPFSLPGYESSRRRHQAGSQCEFLSAGGAVPGVAPGKRPGEHAYLLRMAFRTLLPNAVGLGNMPYSS